MPKRCTEPIEERFFSHVQKGSDNECWIWTGGCRGKYGITFYKGRREAAHRVAYMISKGDIPKGMHIMHNCDNPRCVNPAHLTLGTHQDNMTDKARKGRAAILAGEKCGRTRSLNADNVREIRKKLAEGFTRAEVAKEFGISTVYAGLLERRIHWKYLD